jgi:hypothetical protein
VIIPSQGLDSGLAVTEKISIFNIVMMWFKVSSFQVALTTLRGLSLNLLPGQKAAVWFHFVSEAPKRRLPR